MGVVPTERRNAAVKEAGSKKPTACAISATELSGTFEERFGDLDATIPEIAVRRVAKAALEGAREVKGAQLRDVGEINERNLVGQMRGDVFVEALLLPSGEATERSAFDAGRTVHPNEFVQKNDTESFGVVTRCRFPDLALELECGLP